VKSIKYIGLFFLVVFCNTCLNAGDGESLPTYHWAYDNLRELHLRGFLTELNFSNVPFFVYQIQNSFEQNNLEKQGALAKLGHFSAHLSDEFHLEHSIYSPFKKPKIRLGFLIWPEIKWEQDGTKNYGAYRTYLGWSPNKNIDMVNSVVFDRKFFHDPEYMGRRWRGFAGYTEQAYIRFHKGIFTATFGRDFIRWGTGRDATLLLSDYARPLDHIQMTLEQDFFKYTFIGAQLDPWSLPDSLVKKENSNRVFRYIAGHRLDLRLFNHLYLGINELILYGGPGRDIDFAYFNPFTFYHGESMNSPLRANTLGSIDVDFYVGKGWRMYGELLIDDIQIEKTGPGDLEPNELGWIMGLEKADPFGFRGLTLWTEYNRVANWTYNTPTLWEKHLHHNKPIGHFLGNDFDRLFGGIDYWLNADWIFSFECNHIRKGEGRISAEWTAPWFQHTVEEGYSEPFPTGIIETRDEFQVSIVYQPKNWIRTNFQTSYTAVTNIAHLKGMNDNYWVMGISLWLNLRTNITVEKLGQMLN